MTHQADLLIAQKHTLHTEIQITTATGLRMTANIQMELHCRLN